MSKANFFKRLRAPLIIAVVVCAAIAAHGQRRDNLTDKEDLQIREAQELDLRMKAFVKIINRRFLAIADTAAANSKEVQNDIDLWGDLRTGPNSLLLSDIDQTISEAIAKIDDSAERDMKNPLLGKGLHILADAARDWIPRFQKIDGKTNDVHEKALIASSIELCNQIIEASAKIPREVKSEPKKKKN